VDRLVREVKRMYPVIPFTFFARAKTDVKVGEYTIPAGWKALGCTFSTMHQPQTFSNPDKFDPDRYTDDRAEHKRSDFAFVPQGGGPIDGHRCAGEAFSTVLMKVLAVELLRGYQWTMPPQNTEFDLSAVPPTPKDRVIIQLRKAPAA